MDLRKAYGTDLEKEENGVEVELEPGVFVTICRIGTKGFSDSYRRKTKKYQHLIKRGKSIPEDKSQEILIDLYAKYILVGWRGLELDGEPLEYNEENAKKILAEFKDFRNLIAEMSMDAELFRETNAGNEKKIEEENIKN